MQAVILAAGSGTRLRPHTEDRPKCMVNVCGTPLLHTQIRVLRACGIRDITIVGGYLADRLVPCGCKVRVNTEYAETNMVWTLKCAAQEMGDDFVVSYGDILYPPQVLAAVMESRTSVSVAVDLGWHAYWQERSEDVLADAETLRMKEGLITEIGFKPKSLAEIEGQYIGLMRFSGQGAQLLRDTLCGLGRTTSVRGKPARTAYMTDLLQFFIDGGHPCAAVPFMGNWCEVDTPHDLAVAEGRVCEWIRDIPEGGDA